MPVALVAIAWLLSAAAATAQQEDEEERPVNRTVTRSVAKQLEPALEALKDERYEEAEMRLDKLEMRTPRLSPYERALTYRMIGYLESGRGNMPEAIDYFERCLAEKALTPSVDAQTRFNMAQLYLATGQYDQAILALEEWFEHAEQPTPNAYYMLAIARYQSGDIEGAIEPAEKSVEITDEPQEPWLQLLVGIYYEAKRYEKAMEPLETLIVLNPRKTYWTQLSSLYAHLGKEPQSLAVMQLAHSQGFLEVDRERRQLAQLYLYHDIPYRAARVIEEGLAEGVVEDDADAYAMLANSLLLAREYDAALPPLRKAATLSDDGDPAARLGQVLLDREDYDEAAASLATAIEKGDLYDVGSVELMLGIARYHQKRKATARQHFVAALDHESSRESAEKWLVLLDRESRDG